MRTKVKISSLLFGLLACCLTARAELVNYSVAIPIYADWCTPSVLQGLGLSGGDLVYATITYDNAVNTPVSSDAISASYQALSSIVFTGALSMSFTPGSLSEQIIVVNDRSSGIPTGDMFTAGAQLNTIVAPGYKIAFAEVFIADTTATLYSGTDLPGSVNPDNFNEHYMRFEVYDEGSTPLGTLYAYQAVPEPATAGLLVLSGLFIATYRRFFGKI